MCRGFLDAYEEQTSAVDKQGRKLPRPTTLNSEYSTIKRMWKEVALTEGFIAQDQLHEIRYAKSRKDQSYRRSSFSVEECVQLEKKAVRTYWIEGKSRYDGEGNLLGYHQISRGPNRARRAIHPLPGTLFMACTREKGPNGIATRAAAAGT